MNPLFDFLTTNPVPRVHSRAITAENPTGEKGAGGKASSNLGPGRKGAPCILDIAPGSELVLADIEGSGAIRHIWMTLLDCPSHESHVLKDVELLIYWDNEETPSVKSPLGPFFCLGFQRDYEVHSIPMHVNPRRAMNCFFTMPFRKHAKIVIRNHCDAPIPRLFYQIDYTIGDQWSDDTMYFHAYHQYTPAADIIPGKDVEILPRIKGTGTYLGTFLAARAYQPYCWCEGELKFFLDGDTDYPTICGTGTEDYFGGAWAFGVMTNGLAVETTFNSDYMGYPYHGMPNVNNTIHERCLYRWHLTDPIYFHEDLRLTMQVMGKHDAYLFERQDDIETVAYWYWGR